MLRCGGPGKDGPCLAATRRCSDQWPEKSWPSKRSPAADPDQRCRPGFVCRDAGFGRWERCSRSCPPAAFDVSVALQFNLGKTRPCFSRYAKNTGFRKKGRIVGTKQKSARVQICLSGRSKKGALRFRQDEKMALFGRHCVLRLGSQARGRLVGFGNQKFRDVRTKNARPVGSV
jgi:hypothetical protein